MFEKKVCHKKGVSGHLEMIISFTFFAGFVLFLLVFVRPYDSTNFADSVTIIAHDFFIENTSVSLTRVFVNHTQPNVRCNVPGISENYTIVNISGVDSAFYTLYSEIFPPNSLIDCEEGNYSLGSVEIKKVIFNDSIFLFQQKYNSDYEGLKDDLKIPNKFDFRIDVSGYSMDVGYPGDVSEYVSDSDVLILFSDGVTKIEKLRVGTW